MYTLSFSGLVAAYVFLAVLLISINLYSRWKWPVKAAAIIITTAFYFVTFMSMRGLLGWPAPTRLPPKFRLLAADVEQPNKLTRDKGAIYLWITDADDLAEHAPPRAYRLPYSEPSYQVVLNATAKLKKGVAQLGEFRPIDPDGRRLVNGATRTSEQSANIKFYDMPDPLFPEK